MNKKNTIYTILMALSVCALVFVSCMSAPSIREQSLPPNAYLEDSIFNAYVRNKDMMQQYAQLRGIDLGAFTDFIQSVQISMDNAGLLSLVVNSNALSMHRKLYMMKRIKAHQISEDKRLWEYTDSNSQRWFFDVGFMRAIVISNFEIREITSKFAWSIPAEIQDVQAAASTQAWMWGDAGDFLANLPIVGFSVHWFGIVVTDYQIGHSATVDFMLYYSGNKSARTTLKLFLPALLSNFGLVFETKNSNVNFSDQILFVKNIDMPVDTIDLYMQ